MQRELLESMTAQGMLVGIWASGRLDFSSETLALFAEKFSEGKPLLFIDLGSGKISVDSPFSAESLFLELHRDVLFSSEIWCKWKSFNGITSLGKKIPEDIEAYRHFLFNIRHLQTKFPKIILLFPSELQDSFSNLIRLCDFSLLFVSEEQTNSIAGLLESSKFIPESRIGWFGKAPDEKRFPRLSKELRSLTKLKLPAPESFEREYEKFSDICNQIFRIRILKRNPPEGFRRLFLKFWWLLFIIVFMLPFLPLRHVGSEPSSLREMSFDRDRFSGTPYFSYTFNGVEPLQRIARYAIGRFFALVTTESMLEKYVEETLEKNDFPKGSWEKGPLNIPPENLTLRFLPSEKISNADYDSIAPAWRYFTSMISDSVAYLTELYHETPHAVGRIHQAIDIASRPGARILAPFSGTAWTFKDERGGVVIGIIQKPYVIVFMHCDQLLYLDGQEVMAGDPVATIGMTGQTSGPHVHVVTGVVTPKGNKKIGNISYKVINPVSWFYLLTKKSEKDDK